MPETLPELIAARVAARRHPVLLIALVILIAVAAGHLVFPLLWLGALVAVVLLATGTIGHSRSHHDHSHQDR